MSRKDRVEHALRDELSALIREVKDPRVTAAGLVGVARVECSPDFQVAHVFVSIYGDDRTADKVIAGLTAAAGFLRGPLARRLQLGRPPELRFVHDRSAEMSLRLTDVVREDVAKAAAVGRTGPLGGADVVEEAVVAPDAADDAVDAADAADDAADSSAEGAVTDAADRGD
ncbi:MAG: 30S ribosome-binding factor RbfA [Kofleriaceae bacterium]|nr:30S ribosome-binding factor RbfA [Kofleriaceae bacterium]MBP9170984.1 30S ribosome-binding factor RbfA [Kofleriaceae bacterium]MBP9860625.1 30S ribosome-binding factor RbfA [Kofleriaceae bacterium]